MTRIIVTGGPVVDAVTREFKRYLLNPQVPGSSVQTSWPVEGLDVITAFDLPYEVTTLTLFLFLGTVSKETNLQALIAGLAVRAHSFARDNMNWCRKVSVIPVREQMRMGTSLPIEMGD